MAQEDRNRSWKSGHFSSKGRLRKKFLVHLGGVSVKRNNKKQTNYNANYSVRK